jgi:hypothetical protein
VPDAQGALYEPRELDAEPALAGAVVEQFLYAKRLDDAGNDGRVVDRGDAVLRVLVQRLLLAPVFLGD